ncbi:hypothetical protein HanRHA438_Chr04g0178741 [Helianthus annuus]|nr:hypothetical protein HanRHA438_Chr04g0178741 [Helianthus annuus]
MKRASINKDNEELIEKLADALPHETWGTYLMMLRNKKGFKNLTLIKFIEKIEAQEMEQRKISRMKDFDGEQDIGLYYKVGLNEKTNMSPKVETAFNAKSSSGGSSKGSNSKTSFSSFPSFDPNLSTTKNGKKLQCNIVLNLEDDQYYTEEVAKSHMSLLGTVLESEKGHFKRECTNLEASGAQNPFNNNDYYQKAIYHQVAQQSNQQEPQVAHGRKVIEESSKRACMVNHDEKKSSTGFSWEKYVSTDGKACLIDQDDEKLPEGFSWENFNWDDYDPNKTSSHQAFVARIEEDSDDDNEYYAKRMAQHLKMMAESDSEDEKAKRKKKKVKTPVSSDDEEVPVVKRKVKEVPKFKIDEEADVQKIPVNCETCEIMKKKNSELINNMNRLKESYDVLKKAMNMYNETSDEQATTMKTLQGAFMIKQKIVNNYIEKCVVLEQKLETQRIETVGIEPYQRNR